MMVEGEAEIDMAIHWTPTHGDWMTDHRICRAQKKKV